MPKIGNNKISGSPNFQSERPQYTQIATENMYLLNEITHNVHMQCHRNYIEVKKFNDMLEIHILRNSLPIFVCVLVGDF